MLAQVIRTLDGPDSAVLERKASYYHAVALAPQSAWPIRSPCWRPCDTAIALTAFFDEHTARMRHRIEHRFTAGVLHGP